jgi:hypothetical protein
MDETLTVTRLGVRARLKRALASTNLCESTIETVRRISRNVKHWSSGDMCLRWTAAGMLEAERQFRRIIGHSELAKLAVALEHNIATRRAANTLHTPVATAAPEVAATTALKSFTQRIAVTKFHGDRDILPARAADRPNAQPTDTTSL